MNSGRPREMMSSTGSRLVLSSGVLMALVVLLAGCTTTTATYREVVVPPETMNAYLQDKPPELWPTYRNVLRQGRRNLVLNHMEGGLGAMELGAFDLAEDSFETAVRGIETVYADNETAKKARSLWYEEGMKDFKGEPYERAMAFYYRGLLYMERGDFENARACFRRGLFQDRFAEEKVYRCDFAVLMFLEGWSSQCLGDTSLATEAYEQVRHFRPDFTTPERDHNVLVIAETGTSPRKVADGPGHAELKFRRGRDFTEERACITIGQGTYAAYPIEDVAWQAMTRGERVVDKILKRQAYLKQTHQQIGTTLTEAGALAMLSAPAFEKSTEKIQIAGGAIAVVGAVWTLVSLQMQPRADTRYWDNLPDAVHVFTCKLPAEEQTATVSFLDRSGFELPDLRRQVKVEFVDGQHGLGWTRSRSALPTFQ